MRRWAILVLLFPGCGGGGSGSSAPAPRFLAADARVETDAPGAADSSDPALCCDGPAVYVVWSDTRNGAADIYFNRSADGGATWLAADLRLDTGPAGSASSREPRICRDGASIYVAWLDDRNGNDDVYLNASSDGGATWFASDVRVDTDLAGAGAAAHLRLCCSGAVVYAAWSDERNGAADIFFNRSADGGATWLAADVRLDTDVPGFSSSRDPEIACAGLEVCVVWNDDRDGWLDLYANRSTDAGTTWPASDARIDTDAPGAADSTNQTVCRVGPAVHVVWEDDRAGGVGLRYSRSGDGGATWLPADVPIGSGTVGPAHPEICGDASGVHVVWEDNRNGFTDIYFNRSADGGATWLAEDRRLETDLPGQSPSAEPRICCDGPNVYAVWRDNRLGNTDIFFNRSSDGGATWGAADEQADTDGLGQSPSFDPRVCCDGTRVSLVWRDHRNGPGDIYGNRSGP